MVIRLIYNFSGSRGTRDSFAGFDYSMNLTYLKLIICKFIYNETICIYYTIDLSCSSNFQ